MSDDKLPKKPLSPIMSGDGADEMVMALTTKMVCGECKYFNLAEGQHLMAAQKFVERLVREEHWQARHLASPINQLGLCNAHLSGAPGESALITGKMHKACDQFRRANGLVSISRKTTDPR